MYAVVSSRGHATICETGIQNFECHGSGTPYSYMMMMMMMMMKVSSE
jgi:hypothetical protein